MTIKCRHTTSSDGIEIKPCLACQPTPEEKCEHLWVRVCGDFSWYDECSKCKDVKARPTPVYIKDSPSPEESCEHEWECLTLIPPVYKCSKCGFVPHPTIPRPSPEARVDWEDRARKLYNKIHQHIDNTDELSEDTIPIIAKALSNAFEKGREAR
jgi:hypothetical protein